MCNCYAVCGEDFENTVGMVAGSRGRTSDDVKKTLSRLAEENTTEAECRALEQAPGRLSLLGWNRMSFCPVHYQQYLCMNESGPNFTYCSGP